MDPKFSKYNVYQPSDRRRINYSQKDSGSRIGRKLSLALLCIALLAGLGAYSNHNAKEAAREAELAALALRLERQHRFVGDTKVLLNNYEHIDISVAAMDLNSGKIQEIGSAEPSVAASTTKLITACLYLDEIEAGRQDLDEPVGWFSGREALRQLINRSNDTVWHELNSRLGEDMLSAYAKSLGIDDYDVHSNKISARSISLLLSKLYKQNLLSARHTDMLLSFMQDTNYENFIPPAVPNDLKLYHKVGLVDDQVNDAAIIADSRNAFALVIFTNGNGYHHWDERARLIQTITANAVKAYL